MDSVAIVSGGLDSVTLVHRMIEDGYKPHLLSFNYGQRHRKELTFAAAAAKRLDLRHDIVDLRGLTHLISNSALTSPKSTPGNPGHKYDELGNQIGEFKDIEVPEGHYAEDSMKATVVPNRNMIMLSIAAGVAVNYQYRAIGIGVHGGDHFIYPDCRSGFIYTASDAILIGNEGLNAFDTSNFNSSCIYAPYINKTKEDIAYDALRMGVPLDETWSCYKGGDIHCGRCGTCVERLEAIDGALIRYNGVRDLRRVDLFALAFDSTLYADGSFWRTAIKKGSHNE